MQSLLSKKYLQSSSARESDMKQDHRRFNLVQLARETNTSRSTLYEWIRKGYLRPTQIAGSRMKYSIEAFKIAEAKAFQEALEKMTGIKKVEREPQPISAKFFDKLERMAMKSKKKNNALAVKRAV